MMFNRLNSVCIGVIFITLVGCGGNMTDKVGRYDLNKDNDAPNEYTIDFEGEIGSSYLENYRIYLDRAKNACAGREILITFFHSMVSSSDGITPVGGTNLFLPVNRKSNYSFGSFYCDPTDEQRARNDKFNSEKVHWCQAIRDGNEEVVSKETLESYKENPEFFNALCSNYNEV